VARAPLLVPAIAFVGGIALAALGTPGSCALAAAGAAGLAWPRTRLPAAAALAALAWLALRGEPVLIDHETRTMRFAGTVVGDVRSLGDEATFPFALDGGLTVSASLPDSVAPGDRLVVRGRLLPFDEARNPGEPSRRALALGEGLAGALAGGHLVARAPPDPRDPRGWAARMRAVLSQRLRATIGEPEATVVAGALWGERGTLPREVRNDFQATGTVHVLVTAGLHLGVIAGLIAGILRLCAIPRIAASLLAIPGIAAYAWLSGGHLPSQRAAVMVGLALLARACGARIVSWNALALAAIVVALIWPVSVTTVSFALSFSCVSAIVLFARPLEHALARAALPDRIREALALTISTQIGVWPLSAATFGLVAPYAVLANAVVVPATGIAMLAGIATLACASIPALGAILAAITAFDVDVILRVVAAVAALPGARLVVAPPPALAIVGYDAVAIGAAVLLTRRPRAAIALLAAASIAVLATTLRPPDGRLTITMLDVGQGDGIVVRTPRGRIILVDTGGRLERGAGEGGVSPAELVGERIVLGYLQRQGIRHVDLLIVTHPHGDHVGGCAPILRAMPVDAIADSGQRYGGTAFKDCIHEAAAHGVPVRIARCGDGWSSGDGVALAVLSPCGVLLSNGKNDVNENSIVAMLRYGGFRMLFTGDAGFATEERLLRTGTDVRADVLKVGHHGSAYATSPAFVSAVHPRIALISVGRHNLFGHPAPSTLANLEGAGITVYRTDRCGAITLTVTSVIGKEAMIGCVQRTDELLHVHSDAAIPRGGCSTFGKQARLLVEIRRRSVIR
jgi:competence protein ComEC